MEPTYSYSRITAYTKCPRSYKYRYIDKLREAFTSVEAHLGRAAHASLAWLYASRETAGTASLEALLERFEADWSSGMGPQIRLIRHGDSFEQRRGMGREMLTEHHRGPFQEDRLTTVATEQDLRTRLGGNHRYRGVIDRLAKDERGELHLIDYKTTGRPPSELDEETALQLRSYGLLALERHGREQVRLTYQFLKNRQELSETMPASDAPGLARELGSRISEVERAAAHPAEPSALCAWCGFRERCDVSGYHEGGAASDGSACPRCDGRLRQRNGKFGTFLGCENYPRCRFTRDA